ncbi:MAG: squalene synthase HpnC [Bdellovibrionota bacterium]
MPKWPEKGIDEKKSFSQVSMTSQHIHDYQSYSRLARDHYENFPVASWLISAKYRQSLHAIYAFARTADDYADEAMFDGRRMEELKKWRHLLDECIAGNAKDPLFLTLADTIEKHALPHALFYDLLDAFEQDVQQSEYANWSGIVDYARRSANPIGRLYLSIHGYRHEQLNVYSDAICSALQFTNFWQDVSVDLEKKRVYIPTNIMQGFGYSLERLYQRDENQAFTQVIQYLVAQTQTMFDEGKKLIPLLDGRLQKEIAMIVLGGEMILQKIKKQRYCVLSQRPMIKKKDKLYMLLRACLGYAS